ncbi:MAG: hypothetical protein KBC72_13895 [Acinetobacter sp.]|nr:hypothetical protein [Acinetobacter sp.]
MEIIKQCLCGVTPNVREVFGKLAIGCANKKCKLRPDTWLYSGDVYDIREIIKYWNEGITQK